MNLLSKLPNFNTPDSTPFFFDSTLEHMTIIFLTNIIIFCFILKVITYFVKVYSAKLKLGVLATKYFFNGTLIISQFIATIILQIIVANIYVSGYDVAIHIAIELVFSLQFVIGVIILMNKKVLNYIFKLIMLIFISFLLSFLLGRQLLIWLHNVNNSEILVLWLTWTVLIGFIVTFFYLFELKTTFLHEFTFHLLILLITISNFESHSHDLKILRHSLFLKILLKLIKVLCLLDLFFLIKTVKKTMQNLWEVSVNETMELIELSLLLNALHFFNISQKNGLENLPNKFLKNEINGWMGSLQE
ncbi:hypothetical protein [Spiroplasma endosymbiont of Stenodema calcarata]|uniref:hypothetical protein n=1 Tax=Spiroplasma endosymbiont of Stenodema calcarata TaxID=3139328 RepID=UPI003CCB16F5